MKDQILFTKYSNERNSKFAIRTQIICDENGKKRVVKSPLTEDASDHVKKLLDWEKILNEIYEDTELSMNASRSEGDSVCFEYLEGITLESELDRYLEKKDIRRFLERVGEFFEILRKAENQKKFVKTAEFSEVFGQAELPEKLMCAPVTDIDMVFSNVMIVDGSMQLIDYEWTFDFPIPVNFVIYRALHYYTRLGNTRPLLQSVNLYEHFGLTEAEVAQYDKMEQCFQEYIIRDFAPIRMLYNRISPGCVPVAQAVCDYTEKIRRGRLQVFWDLGTGFSEKDSARFHPKNAGCFEVTLLLPEEAEWIRLDPGEDGGILHIEKLSLDGECVLPVVPAGWIQDEETVIFSNDDPQIRIRKTPGKAAELHFKAYMETLEERHAEKLIKILSEGKNTEEKFQELQAQYEHLALETEQIKAKNNRLRHKLRVMEETKVWKAYRKYRDAIEKRK